MRKEQTIRRLTGQRLEEVVGGRKSWGSESTRKGYEALVSQLKAFAAYCAQSHEPNLEAQGAAALAQEADRLHAQREIDEEFCRAFALFLLSRVKPSSAKGYLERLSALLRQMKSQGWSTEIPEVRVATLMPAMPEVEKAEKVFLTREELRRMQAAECPSESTKNAFLFSCYTGLLKGEVKDLQWDSIRYNGTGLVLSRPVEHSHEAIKVPLIEAAHAILQKQERDYAKLSPEKRDDRVFHLRSNTTISEDLNVWARNAKLEKEINYMTSRHTFATMALRAGVDLYVVAKWCGYSNVSSAEVYADLVGMHIHSDSELLEGAFA